MSLFDESSKLWSSVNISIKKESSHFLDMYVELLRERYANGSVIHNCFEFQFSEKSAEFSEDKVYSYFVKQKLFEKTEIINAFGNYKLTADCAKHFNEMHPYELPGVLATILQFGGAYSPRTMNMANYELALSAALELTKADLNSAQVLYSGSAWSSFFYDVAWDHSIVVYLPVEKIIHIIMATDTD